MYPSKAVRLDPVKLDTLGRGLNVTLVDEPGQPIIGFLVPTRTLGKFWQQLWQAHTVLGTPLGPPCRDQYAPVQFLIDARDSGAKKVRLMDAAPRKRK